MTIKAYIATDSDDSTYIFFIDSAEWLYRDEDGEWQVSEDYPDEDWEYVDISDSDEIEESFGWLAKYIKDELDKIHIPSKDEDPVELDVNFSISNKY